MSLSSMLHGEFKKSLYRHVDFRGLYQQKGEMVKDLSFKQPTGEIVSSYLCAFFF